MPCPTQDLSGITIEWAPETAATGRWGRVTALAGTIPCVATDTSCDSGTAPWAPLYGPSRDSPAAVLVWQHPDGCVVHYRCAPAAARNAHRVTTHDRTHPHPAHTRAPVAATINGIAGSWIFTGATYKGDSATFHAILWSRTAPPPAPLQLALPLG